MNSLRMFSAGARGGPARRRWRVLAAGAGDVPAVEIRDGGEAVDVTGLSADALTRLAQRRPEAGRVGRPVRRVRRSGRRLRPDAAAARPRRLPRRRSGRLRFTPRFPLARGVHYRAVLHPDRLPGGQEGTGNRCEVALSSRSRGPAEATAVEQVYPTADRLPENQLKFYLHFTSPMSRGEAYRRIHLLDADGKEVDRAFLELGEELWDPDGKRFTLLHRPRPDQARPQAARGPRPRAGAGEDLHARH